jgi:hypothetical protein
MHQVTHPDELSRRRFLGALALAPAVVKAAAAAAVADPGPLISNGAFLVNGRPPTGVFLTRDARVPTFMTRI